MVLVVGAPEVGEASERGPRDGGGNGRAVEEMDDC